MCSDFLIEYKQKRLNKTKPKRGGSCHTNTFARCRHRLILYSSPLPSFPPFFQFNFLQHSSINVVAAVLLLFKVCVCVRSSIQTAATVDKYIRIQINDQATCIDSIYVITVVMMMLMFRMSACGFEKKNKIYKTQTQNF